MLLAYEQEDFDPQKLTVKKLYVGRETWIRLVCDVFGMCRLVCVCLYVACALICVCDVVVILFRLDTA